jgi:hypothetical protein
MNEPLHELALSREEVAQVLRVCEGRALLVGGQALAFWAQHFHIRPLDELAVNVTLDADFLGGRDIARDVSQSLKADGWKLWEASFEDATAQSAKLSKRVEGQGIKQIDFLSSIIGLDTQQIKKRAVELTLAGGMPLLILHPLDVLASRLHNLAALSSKRNSQGIAQARLALDVVRSFLEQLMKSPDDDQRKLLNAVERVVQIAQDKRLERVIYEYDLNPLTAVPVEQIEVEEFRARRWPQILQYSQQRRRAHLHRKPAPKLSFPQSPAATPADDETPASRK